MKLRWRWVLPICGLLLFGVIAHHWIVPHNRENAYHPVRYLSWATFHLDSDPLNKKHWKPVPCIDTSEPCIEELGFPTAWYQNTQIFTLAAMPAFILAMLLCTGLGKLGISQVLTFFISMPLLVFAWFYFVGWLFDRLLQKNNVGNAEARLNKM